MALYLDVPYEEKDEAKALGARWDRDARLWYVPDGRDAGPFARWIPTEPDFIYLADEAIISSYGETARSASAAVMSASHPLVRPALIVALSLIHI